MYIWETTPAEDLGDVNAAVAAVLASGITADKVRQAVSAYSAAVEVVDGGAKNVVQVDELGLSTDHDTTYVHQGVTFVLNDDGTVTATRTDEGTEVAVCNLRYDGSAFYANNYCTGDYILSGCPAGGSLETYYLEAINSTGATEYRKADDGTGATLTKYTGDKNIIIRIKIDKSYSPDGLIFKPMICTKAAWGVSHEYQPYRPSYQELYERVVALEDAE